jgi:AbrB family looped-hinge helix DNA binding protein
MIVTLTSKGQLTLPKVIRDQMQLDAGSKLDFSVQEDGTLRARPMRSVSALFGIVKLPKGTKPTTLQELKAARADHVADKYARVLRESLTTSGEKRKR